LILVDTSVWIRLLNAKDRRTISADKLADLCTCSPVVQEVFQGLQENAATAAFKDRFLALPLLSDPLPINILIFAAEIYSIGRRKGFSIRSSMDCLIAAIAIENQATVWHRDRDFAVIAGYTGLRALRTSDLRKRTPIHRRKRPVRGSLYHLS